MRTLMFYGVSDDLFECEGTHIEEPDEIGCYDRPAAVSITTPQEAGLIIIGYYDNHINACWSIGILPLDEDVPIPAWPISVKLGGRGYSAALTIEVPDDAIVKQVLPALAERE